MTTIGEEVTKPAPPLDLGAMTLADISALMASARDALSRIGEQELTAEMEHSRINVHLEHATSADLKHVAFVEAQCEIFLRARLKADPKAPKSVSTAYGTISSRVQQPEYI